MFDPTLPQENTPVDAVQMRAQLNGLKDLIDAVPVIAAAQVEAVNTVPPGTAANATVSVVGNELRFTFDIPQGPQGPAGSDGGEGPPGPPFANAVVDAVNTLPAGDPAAISVNFDGTTVGFTFDIPQGYGGPQGPQGEPGPPGEVTAQQLDDAIASTSANSNAVDTLSTSAPPDYDTAVMQEVIDKLNELIAALRRAGV